MGSHPQTLDALSKITREIDSGRKNLPPYQVCSLVFDGGIEADW
jgi:hypothetical protein